MKLIKNTGNDRVMDALRAGLTPAAKLDIATPAFSVFAFAEFAAQLQNLSACRLVLPDSSQTDLQLLGSDADRAFRNQLTARWLARQCADWISNRVEVRNTQTTLPQSSLIATDADATLSRAITGHCPFTTDGLGLPCSSARRRHGMSFAPIITALALPPETLVGQRVPKKLLVENGAPTAGDKRQINDGIEEILWHAALKPANLGVPAYRDAAREYLEIAILTVSFRPAAKPARLVELIHRAIPYPVLLVATMGETATVSVAHKRWSQGETGQIVIEELRATAPFQPESATAETAQFLTSLSVSGLPQGSLFALYQSWLDSVLALEAAQITGAFRPVASENSAALRDQLDARAQALRDLALLRAQAENETQLNRRVELNLAIKKLAARIAEFDANL